MTVDRVQRRMAAILAADVVGYSRLMGEDEEATLATLKAHREIIDGLITDHHGRIFGSAGDSVIAEFASPVDAVRCATEIQLAIDQKDIDTPSADRMRFRIGINLGDVVVDGDNLMGDGVNVAARLEALAPPGGICVSEAIHAQVRDRLSLDFLDLGEHKLKNVTRPVRAYRVPLASEERISSPFRGLDAFEFDHAGLFFGRARAIAACTERLEQLVAAGKAFLLIYGMSGSGKSSLLRAGLLPAITRAGAVPGIALWRRCLIRPSEGPDAITSLIAGLLREGALPELAEETTAPELAKLVRSAPDRALAPIRAALGKAATAVGVAPSQARLAVAIDQMEELFTTQAEPSSREALVQLLAAFAGSGFVWTIGTIRADFFHRCGEIVGFSALKDGLSTYELLPPTGPEIAQIIREPARVAGLRFEASAGQGQLDDVLQEAAVADPGSLPLLEFVLDALYEAGRERRLLTFAAYRALGGLEGAIARRADEVVDALPPYVQDALPPVLRALTTVRLGDEVITASPALLADVAETPAQSVLVNALIGARLLVSDEDAEGRGVIRVAHEALLSRWPRARAIVDGNRDFLETRARVQADARRWLSDRRNPDLLLPAGKRLAEAEDLLLSRPEELDDPIADYINISLSAQQDREERERRAERTRIEAEEAARRERLEHEAERRGLEAAAATRLAQRTRVAAGIALLLALGAGAGAVVGFRGQQEAVRQTDLARQHASEAQVAATQAKAAETQALDAKDQALRSQSLSLSFLSQQEATNGDTEAAILLALEALPTDMSSPERPYLFEAETALYNALLRHRQTMTARHDEGVTDAAFSPDGDRIVSASFDKTARIWNARDGSEAAVLRGHEGAIERATFSPDGSRVVTAARDGTARVWNAASGELLFVLHQPGDVHTALFSPDGARVLTASELGDTAIWDAKTGSNITKVQGLGTISATFSPDGRSFAAAQRGGYFVRIWSTDAGRLIKSISVLNWPDEMAFSPDGGRLLITSWKIYSFNQHPRLWDVGSGAEVNTLRGHESDIQEGAFSHDGRLIATISVDGTARLWDGASGQLRQLLGKETKELSLYEEGRDHEMNAAFSPDDRLLATISMEGVVRLWDVEQASLFAVIKGHRGFVEHVAFNPSGTHLLTASHDGTMRVWDIDGVLTTALYHKGSPTFAVFSGDGTRVVTGGGNNVAHLWDVGTGQMLAQLETKGQPLEHAAFSPDGGRVVTAAQDGAIVLWDTATGREIARLTSHGNAITHVGFNLDGSRLLSSESDGTARLWDLAGGVELADYKTSAPFRKAIFSPDGEFVLSAANDNTAGLSKLDGTEVASLIGHANRISAAAFSFDGQLIATASLDGTARIWSALDGTVVAILKGHAEPLTDVAFSHDGKLVVTASRDRTARIWRIEDGAELAVLRGHKGVVSSSAISPGGHHVVTASSQDRSVRLWAVEFGRQIAVLAGQEEESAVAPKPTRAAFSPDGTSIVIVSGEDSVRIVRAFQTPQDLIDYAHAVVPRTLTPCERRRFFLPVEGDVGDCPS